MPAVAKAPPAPNRALAFIFVTVLLDTIGFGIIIPVMPQLITTLGDMSIERAAEVGGWLGGAYALMLFVCGPLMGGLSDRYGRRPVLLASLAAFTIDYLLLAWAPTLVWLFVARLIAGMTGASFSTAYAYIADVSPKERRAGDFALVGLAFGLGFIVGPVIGGLFGEISPRAPFLAAAGLTALNFLYGLFILPESLPPERRRPFDWSRANPVGALLRLKRYQPVVLGLLAAVFVWQLAQQSIQGPWSFFVIHRFGWDTAEVGLSLAAFGAAGIVTQGFLVRRLTPIWGERRMIVIGLIAGAAGFLVYAFAVQGWLMYAGILVYSLAGLVYPALQSLMSAQVDADSQGELQGTVSSVMSLGIIIGPPAMSHLFASGADLTFAANGRLWDLSGAAFALAALLTLTTLALAWRALKVPAAAPQA